MNGKLIAAARCLLGLSQADLAGKAGLSRRTVINLENEVGDPKLSTETKVIGILKGEGIEFTETPERVGVSVRTNGQQ